MSIVKHSRKLQIYSNSKIEQRNKTLVFALDEFDLIIFVIEQRAKKNNCQYFTHMTLLQR